MKKKHEGAGKDRKLHDPVKDKLSPVFPLDLSKAKNISELVRGMSGAFAVRSVPGARDAIDTFSQRRDQLRKTVRERGDDPEEIKNWIWPSGEPVAA